MKTNFCDEFIAKATDPDRRELAILSISKRRNKFLCAAVLMALCLFGIHFFGEKHSDDIFTFATCIAWIEVFKLEFDLKLLRIIQRIQKDGTH